MVKTSVSLTKFESDVVCIDVPLDPLHQSSTVSKRIIFETSEIVIFVILLFPTTSHHRQRRHREGIKSCDESIIRIVFLEGKSGKTFIGK